MTWLVLIAIAMLRRKTNSTLMASLFAAGCALLLVAAILGGNGAWSCRLPIYLADAGFVFVADPLSRWFAGIIGLVGLPVALFAPGYLRHLQKTISLRAVWAGMALLFVSMIGVVLAANAILFMVAWEVMAISSFALVASDHRQKSIRQAALIYLGATRVGTAFLMGGFFWAYALTGSWSFADWHLSGGPALGPGFLILVGLATKSGCWPFHLWLPIAHPAAPSPVSAVMSGLMIKTAIYAMVRLFVLGGHVNAAPIGTVLLTLGAISAFWGVIFALLQHDIKRLLAYSTVENSGIILMCVGAAIVASNWNEPGIAQVALAAGLFHSLNHAVFKTLLFFGAGAVDCKTHVRNLEELGGLVRRMPWTSGTFLIGSAALCGLPPLNGFVGEWLLYSSFFLLAKNGPDMGVRLAGILLMAWLAIVGALAVALFAKVVGVGFLGKARSNKAEHASEVSGPLVSAQLFLAFLCAGLGLATPAVLHFLGAVVEPLHASAPLLSIWNIPYLGLSLAILVTALAIAWGVHRQVEKHPTRRFITWECGFGALSPRMQYTSESFTQPISRIFGSIYRYTVDVQMSHRQEDRFPDEIAVSTVHEAYLETRVYAPLLRTIRRVSGIFISRVQAGSIHQYLLYMVISLAVLLWIGVAR